MAKMGILKNVGAGTRDSRAVKLTVKDIPIGDISIKGNVRAEYTNIDELTVSIRRYGLLQPITVYPEGDGYAVKTGHRRYVAYTALYREEPEKYHSIRCVISDGENVAVIQLVENVQRVDLSQLDLFNALKELKAQGMTLRQIAEVMGKTEGYIKSLFVGVNEISKDENLTDLLGDAGITIRDVAETTGINDKQERLNLLEQRKNGAINRVEMRKKVKELKSMKPASVYPFISKEERIPVRMKVLANLREIIVFTDKTESVKRFNSIGVDILAFLTNSEKYHIEVITPEPSRKGGKNA
ncbi:MAG: ParB N-terminal domain-containing protein [Tannerellaceae bacterium]|jgi:ParB family chromosome partitioning protein|nr:ParB N-terminal domain-containing protein [Tannerellaceae bacterium]